jgi:hypothetical protein
MDWLFLFGRPDSEIKMDGRSEELLEDRQCRQCGQMDSLIMGAGRSDAGYYVIYRCGDNKCKRCWTISTEEKRDAKS